MEEIIIELYQKGVIKFGSFEVRKNFISPFQIDYSPVISNGELAKKVCALLWDKIHHLTPEMLTGASIAGSCFANYIAWEQNIPFIVSHPSIDGRFKSGQKCLVVQDRFLAGVSTLETMQKLEDNGLVPHHVLALIDMELGGKKKIKSRGYNPHTVMTISEILQVLFDSGKMPGDHYKLSLDFLDA